MSDSKWLEALKPGDDVAMDINKFAGDPHWMLLKVTRVHAKHIYLNAGKDQAETVVRRDNGQVTGRSHTGNFDYRRIVPVTDEIRKAFFRRRLLRAIETTDFNCLQDATLERVVQAIQSDGE